MKKLTANHPDFLKNIDPVDLLDSDFSKIQASSVAKMLRIRWNELADVFSYRFQTPLKVISATKRQILSNIAKMFNPAGWLTPIIVRAKAIMQQLWLDGTNWDEEVNPTSLAQWNTLVTDLPFIEDINIPRWLNYKPDADIQIHGFCDASKRAYCAALYIQMEYNNQVFSDLLTAKSKVAPLKTVSQD